MFAWLQTLGSVLPRSWRLVRATLWMRTSDQLQIQFVPAGESLRLPLGVQCDIDRRQRKLKVAPACVCGQSSGASSTYPGYVYRPDNLSYEAAYLSQTWVFITSEERGRGYITSVNYKRPRQDRK